MTDARVKSGSWTGFTDTKGDDLQMPPYAAFDFKRFSPDGKREVVVDVLANDYAYSRGRPRLISVDPKSRRGRAVTVRPDSALGRNVVSVEPANERLGFDMFRYTIGDKSGFQSQGYVFLEALRPFWVYEAEDPKVAQGRFGKPKRDDPLVSPGGATYVTLDDDADQATITWTISVPRRGQYGLRFRYQLHREAGAVASRWTTPCADSLRPADSASSSDTAPAIRSAAKSMEWAPTWTIMRRMTSVRSSWARASRSSRASTCLNSEFGRRWMCWLTSALPVLPERSKQNWYCFDRRPFGRKRKGPPP